MEGILITLIPLGVPLVVAAIKRLLTQVPSKWIPILTGLGGAVIGLANAVASTNFSLEGWTQDTLSGAIVALAGVGIHQIYKQRVKGE